MSVNRVEVLKSMLAHDAKNSFARYGLAQEYVNQGEFAQAIEHFNAIFANDPTYQAAYYHAGRTYEKMNEIERAKATYQKGIAMAIQNGDPHAEGELQMALDALS